MVNVAITYFNYNEILLRARGDPAAIIILTHAQTKYYNELTTRQLMKSLCINHIPIYLFRSKTLVKHRKFVKCIYRTKEPQSYIKNVEFLKYNINARYKALYIRALSMRKISEHIDYIPRSYFGNISKNPLITYDDDKIYFPLESKQSSR